tara:strand:+ start:1051 stop:1335 length:285 start_codon:yes stop_codon:yes gene_type:complete
MLENSINEITKDNPNRWFLVYDNDAGEGSFVLFGYVGDINVNQLETGQPNILAYLTEDELETYLDSIAGAGYYKNAVESESEKFQTPSQKYVTI